MLVEFVNGNLRLPAGGFGRAGSELRALPSYERLPSYGRLLLTSLSSAPTLRRLWRDSHLYSEDSMAINTQKVVVGGIVAGVVMTVIGFVSNMFILGARMKAESDAFKPGLADQMMQGPAIITNIVMNLILGIALVWTYAAIRPRFGPGLKTATYVAALFWLLASIFYSGYMHMGMMSAGLWWSFAFVGLVNFFLSAWAGAKLYSEGPAA